MEISIKKPNLTTYQEEILYNDARFTFTEASTKVGKTFSHIWWLFECAIHGKPNQNFWWVAPVYSQTKIAFKRLRVKVGKYSAFKINESNLTITFPNGAVIHFKSAEKPDNLFGEDVYAIVFDEAPRARVDAFYALRSTITHTGGKMKLIGNFGGTANWMHQLKERAKKDPEYSYYKITAWDAVEEGILSREEIEQAQRDLPPKIFKALYLAEEQESNDMLVGFDDIRSLWHNEHVEEGQRFITADIALHGSDRFVLLVWSGLRMIHYLEVDKMDAKECEELLRKVSKDWRVPLGNIIYDADGLGTFLRGYLSAARPFNNGLKPVGNVNYRTIKDQCIYKLADLIKCNEVYIECEVYRDSFVKELECLQSYNLDAEGKIQALPKKEIKKLIGRSPDILDAMLMRCLPLIQNRETKIQDNYGSEGARIARGDGVGTINSPL